MSTPRIALISGSIRTGSINRTHVKAFVHLFRDAGANPVTLDLNDYPMPLYNGDWEAEHGPPKTTKNLILRLKRYDGVFISTPEYNGCIPPLRRIRLIGQPGLNLGILLALFTGSALPVQEGFPGSWHCGNCASCWHALAQLWFQHRLAPALARMRLTKADGLNPNVKQILQANSFHKC